MTAPEDGNKEHAGADPELLRRSKISPHLRAIIGDWERRGRTLVPPGAKEGAPGGNPTAPVLIELKGTDTSELERAGIAFQHLFKTFYGAELPLDEIERLADFESILRVHHEERMKPSLNDSIPEIRANTVRNPEHPFGGTNKFTGKGVMIGIIDSGINILHPVFRDPADQTKTRIRAILDQTANPVVSFTRAQIEAAIAADTQIIQPGRTVGGSRVETKNSDHKHGTHVAGIAAGNGKKAGNCRGQFVYVGVAPEAELVIVKYDFTGTQSLQNAINFCVATAQPPPPPMPPTPPPTPPPPPPPPVPLVINMSLGHAIGPHDGTDPMDQMIDTFLNPTIPPAPGTLATVLVAAAGNEGKLGAHAAGTIPQNGIVKRIRFELSEEKSIEGAPTTRLEIRFTAPNGLICKLIPPGNKTNGQTLAQADNQTQFIELKENSTCTIDGTPLIGAPPNARRVLVTITQANKKKRNQKGTWVLEVSNAGANPIAYNAWIDGDQYDKILDEQTRASTLSSPGSARDIITVGAYHPIGKDKGKLADFSSRGPRLGGLAKPDLSAPGVDVRSAKRDFHDGCCCDCCCGSYINMDGTSMAAPHVAGAVALMLERNPTLTHAQIKAILMDTARREFFTGLTLPNFDFGNGKLHVLNALNDVRVRGTGPVITGGGGAAAARVSEHPDVVEAAHAALELPQLEEGTPLSRLLRSREGRRLYERGMRHWEEARELVNSDKRVATVWHRNHGPLVLHHVIRATMLPDVPLPRELEGEELAVRAARLVTALEKHASKDLIRALHATLPLVRQLQGKTLREVVELFESRSELQHA